MDMLSSILSENDRRRWWTSIGITVLIAGLLSLLGIYGIREYGLALFVFTPFYMGAGSAILYGYKRQITYTDSWKIGFATLGIFTLCLIGFALEGIICIVMAAPIALIVTWLGSLFGYLLISRSVKNAPTTLLILIGVIPIMGFAEKKIQPTLTPIVTTIEINASPETVWKNVVEFPQLKEPTEFIFKTGIAYPINAKIDGKGVGAVRHCNFTTGNFVEPITVWDEPHLLKFSVAEQPAPMKELSIWNIDAPHLHNYFVSKQGQFKLTALPNGKTQLEGTTWYYHNIKPAFYWVIWSDLIIHKIHDRVLLHIKVNAERDQKEVKAEG
ncbi:MAG: hypothetical protein JWO03_629 [Bacteroidetes bacterium]|nr:hypothetical protein [Bacteroidota bacterium]